MGTWRNYYETYEINAHVVYRNDSTNRHNICISIAVNNDTKTKDDKDKFKHDISFNVISQSPFSYSY